MWCPACIVMNKFWKNIKNKYNNIEFVDYDLDLDDEKVKEYNVGNKLPVIIFSLDGNETKRIVGEKNEQEIEKEIEDWLYEKSK